MPIAIKTKFLLQEIHWISKDWDCFRIWEWKGEPITFAQGVLSFPAGEMPDTRPRDHLSLDCAYWLARLPLGERFLLLSNILELAPISIPSDIAIKPEEVDEAERLVSSPDKLRRFLFAIWSKGFEQFWMAARLAGLRMLARSLPDPFLYRQVLEAIIHVPAGNLPGYLLLTGQEVGLRKFPSWTSEIRIRAKIRRDGDLRLFLYPSPQGPFTLPRPRRMFLHVIENVVSSIRKDLPAIQEFFGRLRARIVAGF